MGDKEQLITVDGLSKKFCKDLKMSLWYGVKDLLLSVTGNKVKRGLRPKEFWAVKDISFTLKRGECLGLIGHNGAGKSTLLKILNGLINPDEGKVVIKGRVGALIELGAGFNPILTGRENIYNNGAVLGFTKREIDAKLEEIIDFSEIREFIDMPVQNYSSGMKVRLGFAVAAQMEPDVLIIDEVLAVGDLGFVLKCFKTIDNILPNTAIVFVSHNMPMVSRICNQVILMDKGKSIFQGDNVAKAIDKYYNHFMTEESNIVYDQGSIKLEKVEIKGSMRRENDLDQFNWGDDFEIFFKWRILKEMDKPEFSVIIFDIEQRPVALLDWKNELIFNSKINETFSFKIVHEKLQLSKGIYSINVLVSTGTTRSPLLRMNNIISFQMLHPDEIWPPFLLKTKYKIIK